MSGEPKQEKDFTKEVILLERLPNRVIGRPPTRFVPASRQVDEEIPKAVALAQSGRLQDALESLLSLEKQTRTVSSFHLVDLTCLGC